MKFTGYITVRLNSKRVPKKSIQKVGEKTLIDKAIATLNNVKELSDIFLYCSTPEIKQYINPSLDYTFIKRPTELNGDNITFNNILENIIDQLNTDYIVFLCCTSPFIKAETISDIINQIKNKKFDSGFTAVELKSFCWYKNKPLNYNLNNVPKTQDLEPVLEETSGLYIFSKDLFKKHKRRIGFKPYIKIVDIFEGWDIDTQEDLKIARIFNNL